MALNAIATVEKEKRPTLVDKLNSTMKLAGTVFGAYNTFSGAGSGLSKINGQGAPVIDTTDTTTPQNGAMLAIHRRRQGGYT